MAWALAHREFFPVDVNRAERRDLLRIPGVGARAALTACCRFANMRA